MVPPYNNFVKENILRLVVDSELRVTAPEEVRKRLTKMATWPNPKWAENDRRGFSNWNTPRELCLAEDNGETVSLPRGLINQVWGELYRHGRKVETQWNYVERWFEHEYKVVELARAYQRDARRAFCWQGMVVMPCGAGKTYFGVDLVSRLRQKTFVLVHMVDLMDQWAAAFKELMDCEVGIFRGKKRQFRDVTVGTVQTVSKMCSGELMELFGQYGFVILDECFPCHTKIDGVEISSIKVGDYVTSFNHDSGKKEKRKVLRLFRTRPEALVTVSHEFGSFTCTASHPVYTPTGYMPAISLTIRDHVRRGNHEDIESDGEEVQGMRMPHQFGREKRAGTSKDQCSLLLGGMQENLAFQKGICHIIGNEQEICCKKDERKKSNARPKREEGRISTWSLVVGIQVHEQTSDDTFGGMCPDGFVYNIEVEGNHNYFAENILVHNCHHAPAASFQRIVNSAGSKYRLGLTATPYRNDGLTDILGAVFGDVAFEIDQEWLAEKGHLIKPVVKRVATKTQPDGDVACKACEGTGCTTCGHRGTQLDYNKLLEEICNDKARQRLIAGGIVRDIESGHSVLALATRKSYLEAICQAVAAIKPDVAAEILTSDTPKGRRKAIIAEAVAGTVQVLFGTQLADEGLNIPRISRIHLMLPSKAKSATVQRIGRMMRPHESKTESPELYDYVDNHPVCYASWQKRQRYYKEIGADFA